MPEALVNRTARVIVRHSAECKDAKKGADWRRCACPKSLLVYDGATKTNRRISAKTRSWTRAEKAAQEWLDSFDPEKQELKRLRAEKEQKQVRLEDAVSLYIEDMITRLGDNGTVAMARSLFGHIDAETKAIVKNGHFFDWIDRLPQRPTFIAEITPAHLTAWRGSWKFKSDLTAANRWIMVKGFFHFCEVQGWLDDSPARKLKPLPVKKGNRTAIFSDDQYTAILDAIDEFQPAENVPSQTRRNWRERLRAFIVLLRWSGMDLVDAVQFRPEYVDQDGVLRYRRQKTGVLATVPLPEHAIVDLRAIPLERDSAGTAQPFRTKDTDPKSDTRKWAHRLCALFKFAGITSVRTELGRDRAPHPKMFRDTFAVGLLRHGARIHTVSKMLGHTTTTTTEGAYLPWVAELEAAHIADAREALKTAAAKPAGKLVKMTKR